MGFESPECFLHLPFKKGDTWETAHTHEGGTTTAKYTSAAEEVVEVPAGKYRCLRVDSEFVYDGVNWTRKEWLAPRCGMVKEAVVGKDGVHEDYVRVTVLKSFTPGGK
jgi:hypothetical protein